MMEYDRSAKVRTNGLTVHAARLRLAGFRMHDNPGNFDALDSLAVQDVRVVVALQGVESVHFDHEELDVALCNNEPH